MDIRLKRDVDDVILKSSWERSEKNIKEIIQRLINDAWRSIVRHFVGDAIFQSHILPAMEKRKSKKRNRSEYEEDFQNTDNQAQPCSNDVRGMANAIDPASYGQLERIMDQIDISGMANAMDMPFFGVQTQFSLPTLAL